VGGVVGRCPWGVGVGVDGVAYQGDRLDMGRWRGGVCGQGWRGCGGAVVGGGGGGGWRVRGCRRGGEGGGGGWRGRQSRIPKAVMAVLSCFAAGQELVSTKYSVTDSNRQSNTPSS